MTDLSGLEDHPLPEQGLAFMHAHGQGARHRQVVVLRVAALFVQGVADLR